jgi:hypothetical protein
LCRVLISEYISHSGVVPAMIEEDSVGGYWCILHKFWFLLSLFHHSCTRLCFKTVHNVFVSLTVCRMKCGNVLDVVLGMYFIAFALCSYLYHSVC